MKRFTESATFVGYHVHMSKFLLFSVVCQFNPQVVEPKRVDDKVFLPLQPPLLQRLPNLARNGCGVMAWGVEEVGAGGGHQD